MTAPAASEGFTSFWALKRKIPASQVAMNKCEAHLTDPREYAGMLQEALALLARGQS